MWNRVAASELPSFLLFLGCLEVFAVINGSLLFSAGLTAGVPKYLGRELSLSLLLLLPVLLPGRIGSTWSVLLYLILALFTCANWIHAALFASPVSSYVVSVFQETYTEEVVGFLEQYASPALLLRVLAVIALTLPLLILSLKLRPRTIRGRWIILVAILLVTAPPLLRHPEKTVRRNYAGDFFLSCIEELEERKTIRVLAEQPPALPPGIRSVRREPRLLVIVIGESSARGHYSLYGYPRPTTPLLDQRKDELLIFTNVISPHAHTVPSLEKALTFANHEGEGAQASMVDALKAGGYHVTTVSNQPPLGEYETAVSRLLGRADNVHFLNHPNMKGFYGGYYNSPHLDETLLDPLKETIAKTGDIAVILHLMGSHGPYAAATRRTEPALPMSSPRRQYMATKRSANASSRKLTPMTTASPTRTSFWRKSCGCLKAWIAPLLSSIFPITARQYMRTVNSGDMRKQRLFRKCLKFPS